MASQLQYGTDATVALDVEPPSLVAECKAPRGTPLDDLSLAVRQALAAPLEFPPLTQAVVPDDKVVLALSGGVPQAATVIAQTVEVLASAGVAPHDITVLTAADDRRDWLEGLPREVRAEITLKVHNPHAREALSYVAASREGKPIYIDRAIHDADLVISIGCLRLDDALDYHGPNAGVFPAFSDAASRQRYLGRRANTPSGRQQLRSQADEVGWLLGIRFTIQVVPGAGGEVLQVLAGNLDAVAREGAKQCREAWHFEVPERAELVIATIEGGPAEQTWINLARALAAAGQAVKADGSVVVCSELAEPPGAALTQVVGAANSDVALAAIDRDDSLDLLPARELVRALSRGRVYLVSRLNDEVVEELGVLPVTDDQVSRLAHRHASCIILANAPHAIAYPRDEATPRLPKAGSKSRR